MIGIRDFKEERWYRRVPIALKAYQNTSKHCIRLRTEHGTVTARPTDWIIEGCMGEIYPCADDVFKQIYNPVRTETEAEVYDPRN